MILEEVVKDLEKDLEVFKEYLLSIDFIRNDKDLYLFKNLSVSAKITWKKENGTLTISPKVIFFRDSQFIFRGGIMDAIDYLLLYLNSENLKR